jgi:hypothetical protein
MHADACPGWSLDHWEIKNAAGQYVPYSSNAGTDYLQIYMNWHTTGFIHVPNGMTMFNVKAVFKENCPCNSQCGDDSNLTAAEWLRTFYNHPFLRECNVYKTAEATPDPPEPPDFRTVYNCIGFVGNVNTVVWRDLDVMEEFGGNNNGIVELNEVEAFFAYQGVSQYIIYGFPPNIVKHAAKKLSDGTCAESKLGLDIQIKHDIHEMEDGTWNYGNILSEHE